MSAGPPLPVDLWDSLSPETRTLIRTLQAEAAELRAKVRALQRWRTTPVAGTAAAVRGCGLAGSGRNQKGGDDDDRPLHDCPDDHTREFLESRRLGVHLDSDPGAVRHLFLKRFVYIAVMADGYHQVFTQIGDHDLVVDSCWQR